MFAKLAIVVLVGSVVWLPGNHRPQESRKSATSKSSKLDAKKLAWNLSKMDNWVRKVEIETMESAPPQFAVQLWLWMPSPGWKLEVDKVDPQKDGNILVKVTGRRPKGMGPAVMTKTKLRVTLGKLAKGEYLLDVWGRLDKTEKHRRKGVVLLRGGGR